MNRWSFAKDKPKTTKIRYELYESGEKRVWHSSLKMSGSQIGIRRHIKFCDWQILFNFSNLRIHAQHQPLTMALVVPDKNAFQHILRLLNTNVDGKDKIMFALTKIKGVGRRYSNVVIKKVSSVPKIPLILLG
jgi:hypothetical protein